MTTTRSAIKHSWMRPKHNKLEYEHNRTGNTVRELAWQLMSRIELVPESAGIYRFESRRRGANARGYRIMYVGKASNLRTEIRQSMRRVGLTTDRVRYKIVNGSTDRFLNPIHRRLTMDRLDMEERKEINRATNADTQACGRNQQLKRWLRDWNLAGCPRFLRATRRRHQRRTRQMVRTCKRPRCNRTVRTKHKQNCWEHRS